MFAGVADYGVYLNAAVVKIEGKSSRTWFGQIGGGSLTHKSRAQGDPLNLDSGWSFFGLVGSFLHNFFRAGAILHLVSYRRKTQGKSTPRPDLRGCYPRFPVTAPQQESTTTTTSSTNSPANQSRWVTPLVFVQALAYVLHRVNRCRGRRDMVWDVEMLTVCETVCLLAGFPQEGYDPSVHLPAPVQVSRNRDQRKKL